MKRSFRTMERASIKIPAWFIERRIEPPYVIINDRILENFGDVFQRAPGEEFYEAIANYMNGYLQDRKPLPAEIEPAIMNLIDDYAAGRRLTLKAGDYIALQTFFRKTK